MARALRMAEIIAARHNLRAVPSEGITDMSFGEWESRPVTEVQKNYPKLYAEWVANPHLCRPPGGDSLEEVRTRAVAFVDWVIKNHRGYVVLVSHRVVHKLLVLALLGLDNSRFWAIKMDTAAVTTFTYGTRGYVLAEHNNTSFLAPLAQPPRRDF
jgi:broad specificity phosphatase PhoE